MQKDKALSSNYLNTKAFFSAIKPYGLTYDDVSLVTQYSEVLPKETIVETHLSETLKLHIPIISADMDTVTESRMAIAMALQGGLGLIHYNMPEKDQCKAVARVKNHVHGLIQDPIKVSPTLKIQEVLDLINKKKYNFRTFPVVDKSNKLLGLLTSSVVRERFAHKSVQEAMVPRTELPTIEEKTLGKDPILVANRFFDEHMGIHKLLVVDKEDTLRGLFTLSDIERIIQEAHTHLKPARDSEFRLVCGAAVGLSRKECGSLDKEKILNHIGVLVSEKVDVIALSFAHGFTKSVGDAIALVREHFNDLTIIAGNVTSLEGVSFLAKKGANVVKIGQGPGSICTTRNVAGVGVPQLTALYECSQIKHHHNNVKIIADGGINKSGDIVKALTLSDAVICGGLLAGCKEAPGKIIEINGKFYKEYRGMGSHEAMKKGSAVRYGHEGKDVMRKAAAEGIEGLKEVSEGVDKVLNTLVGGLQAGMGYLGAKNLDDLKEKAHYVRVTPAAQKESGTHDVIELKTLSCGD